MVQDFKSCDCKGCELKSLFFENVKEEELTNICDTKNEKVYFKGESIINEGEEIKYFMYLKDGLVKLHKKANNNRDQIIKFARPLDFVSMLSVFSNKKFQYSVTAIEDSTVCYLDLDFIKTMAYDNGQFAMDLLIKLSKMSDDIIKTTLEIRRRNLRGRIAYVLIYFANEIYKNNSFELPVSRKEIAELIEMTTENVIRILSEFRKDGILKIFGKTIEIIDMDRLQRISNLG